MVGQQGDISSLVFADPPCFQTVKLTTMDYKLCKWRVASWMPASQPFCGPRMADMARTLKMQLLPGARMDPSGARAQGAVAGDILGRLGLQTTRVVRC